MTATTASFMTISPLFDLMSSTTSIHQHVQTHSMPLSTPLDNAGKGGVIRLSPRQFESVTLCQDNIPKKGVTTKVSSFKTLTTPSKRKAQSDNECHRTLHKCNPSHSTPNNSQDPTLMPPKGHGKHHKRGAKSLSNAVGGKNQVHSNDESKMPSKKRTGKNGTNVASTPPPPTTTSRAEVTTKQKRVDVSSTSSSSDDMQLPNPVTPPRKTRSPKQTPSTPTQRKRTRKNAPNTLPRSNYDLHSNVPLESLTSLQFDSTPSIVANTPSKQQQAPLGASIVGGNAHAFTVPLVGAATSSTSTPSMLMGLPLDKAHHYAGPTFHNAPPANTLPMPDFVSVPTPETARLPLPDIDDPLVFFEKGFFTAPASLQASLRGMANGVAHQTTSGTSMVHANGMHVGQPQRQCGVEAMDDGDSPRMRMVDDVFDMELKGLKTSGSDHALASTMTSTNTATNTAPHKHTNSTGSAMTKTSEMDEKLWSLLKHVQQLPSRLTTDGPKSANGEGSAKPWDDPVDDDMQWKLRADPVNMDVGNTAPVKVAVHPRRRSSVGDVMSSPHRRNGHANTSPASLRTSRNGTAGTNPPSTALAIPSPARSRKQPTHHKQHANKVTPTKSKKTGIPEVDFFNKTGVPEEDFFKKRRGRKGQGQGQK